MRTEEEKDDLIKRQCEYLERGLVIVKEQQGHIRELWEIIHEQDRRIASIYTFAGVCAIGFLVTLAILIWR